MLREVGSDAPVSSPLAQPFTPFANVPTPKCSKLCARELAFFKGFYAYSLGPIAHAWNKFT